MRYLEELKEDVHCFFCFCFPWPGRLRRGRRPQGGGRRRRRPVGFNGSGLVDGLGRRSVGHARLRGVAVGDRRLGTGRQDLLHRRHHGHAPPTPRRLHRRPPRPRRHDGSLFASGLRFFWFSNHQRGPWPHQRSPRAEVKRRSWNWRPSSVETLRLK